MRKYFYHAYNPAPKELWGSRTLQIQREHLVTKWSETGLLDALKENHDLTDMCDAVMMSTYMNFREEHFCKPKS